MEVQVRIAETDTQAAKKADRWQVQVRRDGAGALVYCAYSYSREMIDAIQRSPWKSPYIERGIVYQPVPWVPYLMCTMQLPSRVDPEEDFPSYSGLPNSWYLLLHRNFPLRGAGERLETLLLLPIIYHSRQVLPRPLYQ
jgi:hypothetical protein